LTNDLMYFSYLINSLIFFIYLLVNHIIFFIAENLFLGYEIKCMEKYVTNYLVAIIETRDENRLLADETIRNFYFFTLVMEKVYEYL
ncbi:hypothetical protein ACHK7U_00055, partial [Staphylococcus hominis]